MTELELLDRERRATERRIHQARFDVVKSLDSFDFLALPSLNKALVLQVRFTTAASLAHELIEAKDERRLMRFQKMLSSFELLIIDELGFVPVSKTGAELLVEVFSRRYERSATFDQQPAVQRMDGGVRIGAADRSPTGSSHPPCPHPGDERGKLPAQGQQAPACREVPFLIPHRHPRRFARAASAARRPTGVADLLSNRPRKSLKPKL